MLKFALGVKGAKGNADEKVSISAKMLKVLKVLELSWHLLAIMVAMT